MIDATCPDCEEFLDHLDTITNRKTGSTVELYVCRNEDCDHYGQIYHVHGGVMLEGDPTGMY